MKNNNLYDKHKDVLDAAIEACATRKYWSAFTESPSGRFHPDGEKEAGKAKFEAQLGKPFSLEQPAEIGRVGREVSPYTQKELGIDYPKIDVDIAMKASRNAMTSWRQTTTNERVGICLEMAITLERQCFENAYATMHTAGQAFLMAYSGSGPNALDRGVEAIVYAYKALSDIPQTAQWTKTFGRAGDVTLNKTYRIAPRGTAIVICCATFPMWNAYPAIFANLVTANPVIVKPHPNGILPVAMAVRTCRKILADNGYDPNLIIMAADTRNDPITIPLLKHENTAIIDYTGSQRFGSWIEKNCSDKLIYTETAGCNGAVIESTDNLDGLINGLANSLCAFSAQMCTSPQNIHMSQDGIDTDQGHISFDQFSELLCNAITERTQDGAKAAALCGAIQSDLSLEILDKLRNDKRAKIMLDFAPYAHPEFPNARTSTPLVLQVETNDNELYQEEHFAPVSFLIKENDPKSALENAANNARKFGAIASYLYSKDRDFVHKAQEAFADAGASLWCNMTVPMPINFAAAYSDYHVTGLNPAGNACLTDLAFVTNRFRIIQFREPVVLESKHVT